MTILPLAAALLAASAPAQGAADPPRTIRPADPAIRWGACPPIFAGDCAIAVLHGDPAKPNADVWLRVGGGTTLPPHRHSSAERMVLVAGTLRVDYSGAPPATLTPGDYAYGPAGLAHSAACIGTPACILFIAFEGPVDALAHDGGVD